MSFFIEASEVNPNATYKVINMENKLFLGNFLQKFLEENTGDILVLNDKINPIIIQIIDKQKYLYNQKKAQKEQEKKQKASIQKVKEIKFHLNIADNDMNIKISHTKKFLDEDNCKVKIVLELRGRENNMKDYAEEMFQTILSNFSSYNITDQKNQGNMIFAIISK